MGKLDKQTFSQFAEFDCERQLFINLGRDDPDWIFPADRKIKPLEDVRRKTNLILEIGKQYENEIYQSIKKRPFTVFSSHPTGSVVKTSISPQKLLNIINNVTLDTPKVLLEHEFPTPKKFLLSILGIANGPNKIPVIEPSNKLRPDILILKKYQTQIDTIIRTLDEKQNIKTLTKNDLEEKVGISIVDIKVSPNDAIGKKQFIELAFYTLALNRYLFDNKLDNKIFVQLDSNGILPKVENTFVDTLEDLEAKIECLRWDETFRLFDNTAKGIQKLKTQSPCTVEKTMVNIQPACGRCNYLEDCKTTLGVTETGEQKDWDVRLLPYTSRSMVEQLIQRGFKTVGDVAEGINNVKIGSTPEAIYPQLPLLKIKSQAIVENKEIKPAEGSIHSVAIPAWNEMSLTVNVEEDPIYKRILALSYYLNISVPTTAKYADNFDILVSIWAKFLKEKMPIARVKQEIKRINSALSDGVINPTLKALQNLWKLKDDNPNSMRIVIKGDKVTEEKVATNNFLTVGYANVNSGLDNYDEFNFAKKSVKILHDILLISDFIEQFVIFYEEIDGKHRYYSPRLAIYYWSREILEAIQTMLERHLNSFTEDDESRNAFYYIIRWFTPTDSGIADPLQHKKVYDLRIFVETTIGLPAIINYTWHAIAEQRYQRFFKKKYWRKHFNYVDFQVWHELLVISDISEKYQLVKELKSQMLYKVQTIDRIRFDFQSRGRELISRFAKPTDYFLARRNRLPNTYNYIAHMWFLFSKLTSAIDEHDALFIRTMYPEFSIGKLAAGEVSEIEEHDGTTEKRRYYTFKLKSLSSNMKVSEGNRVLLLPSELRDVSIFQNSWSVNIDQLTWNAFEDCYDVVTQESTVRVYENFTGITKKEISTQWYLFPTSFDAWSRKLYLMLNLHNLGHSWLGRKIAFDWKLLPLKELEYPESSKYELPEIYLFAPTLVDKYSVEQEENLKTKVFPIPDLSQKEAILHSLSRPISMIHGPPGTGKSQTIVALIDEFLDRTKHLNRPRRILVTAFSYPAMRVLVNKIRESSDRDGEPTEVRKIPKIFIRSGYQKIVSNEGFDEDDLDFIHDFMCNKGGTWKLNEDLNPKQRGTITVEQKLENHFPGDMMIFSNAHQLTKLRFNGKKPSAINTEEFAFDLILIDEASQLPVDQILPSITMIHRPQVTGKFSADVEKDEPIESMEVSDSFHIPNHIYLNLDNLTKLVFVGDNFQLPPVQPIKPPINLEIVLGSVFQYYREGHKIPSRQLKTNYRSHQHIVDYTGNLGFYDSLTAFQKNANTIIGGYIPSNAPEYVKAVLDPNLVVSSIIHNKKFEVSVSPIETEMTVEIIVAFFKMMNPKTVQDQIRFWKDELGVVAPHNAQGRLIIRNLFERLSREKISLLSEKEFMNAIKSTVYSVEKFQGSDRTMIIASIGISSVDQISAEEDFIFDINRFNVLTSRAKSKVILIASRNYIDYYPNNRVNVENASQIRYYTLEHCNKSKYFSINFDSNEEEIEMRWHE